MIHGQATPTDQQRLEAIQRHVDSYTVGILDNLPVATAWDCLELGAGAGSIAYLIHARYVLCHLTARDDVIARAVDWLRPEGWLVIDEPHLLPADTSPFPAIERLMAAYERNYARLGAGMTLARSLPATLARNGLTDVTHSGNLGCMRCLDMDRWLLSSTTLPLHSYPMA